MIDMVDARLKQVFCIPTAQSSIRHIDAGGAARESAVFGRSTFHSKYDQSCLLIVVV
jgi:hypothetical protein